MGITRTAAQALAESAASISFSLPEFTVNFFDGKRILVTGCCGTIGSELLFQLVKEYNATEIIGIDNNESELFFIEQRAASFKKKTRFYLTDIRNYQRLKSVFCGVDIIFHTAAFKHVVLCERSPFEAVSNNINAVESVIRAAQECGVERVIFTSSDKAVNPTSVMGTSKLMGERLFTAANSNGQNPSPIFVSTRFGNVLGSRGSVIPIFRRQIMKGGPLTLTDERMTRFIMSIPEAVRLVIDTARIAKGGEVFITKMPVIRIRDLAEVMIRELAPMYGHKPDDITVSIIGSKPGEKLYEELMSEEEAFRSMELDRYYVVKPALQALYREFEYSFAGTLSDHVEKAYNSQAEQALSQEELKQFLLEHNLLEELATYSPDERYWPDSAGK